VLPVLVAWIAYVRRGGFQPETGLTNADEGSAQVTAPEQAPVEPEPALPYSVWSRRRRLAAVLVVVAAALLLGAVSVQKFGEEPRFALGPARARAIADEFARVQRFDPRGYRTIAFPATEWESTNARLTGKYFVERRDVAFVADAFHRDAPLHSWTVRFFKPLEREEMQVSVDPETGRVFEFNHVLPEDRPGADLPAESARGIAAAFLASRGFDLQRLDLKETKSEKKKARTDHTLVWEAKAGDPRNLDDARFRVRVVVAGDQVASLGTYWKLPETFERARSRRNALSNLLLVLRIAVSASLLVLAIWLLVDRTRKHALRWRRALWIALPLAAIALAGMAVQFPLLFSQYDTAMPLQSFEVMTITGLAISALALFVALACGAALILSLRPDALAVFQRATRKLLGLDALYAAGLAAVLAAALGRIRWILIDRFHPQALLSAGPRTVFGTAAPAASGIAGACQETLFWLALLVLLAYAAQLLARRPWAAALAVLAGAAAFVPSPVHTAGEFFLYYAIMLAYAAAAVAFARYFARGNALAYVLTVWTLSLAGRAADLLGQPDGALRFQGGVLAALLLATLVWAVAPALVRRKPITMVLRDSP